MFQFPAFATARQAGRFLVLPTRGLPHSETVGLTGMCPSPTLIAAYRVLRRLSDPRHPPCALAYFAFVITLVDRNPCGFPSALRFVFVTPYVKERASLLCLVTIEEDNTAPIKLDYPPYNLNVGKDAWC
jgi:hypothetical protein